MVKIVKVKAREILDSRGNPTVEAEVTAGRKTFTGSAPSGASTGSYEALELRDGDPSRYHGKGVLKAVENINTRVAKALKGKPVETLAELDRTVIKLDGTKNKSNLGANATTAVSFALMKAVAHAHRKEVYEYLGGSTLPVPFLNIINGGKHAGNGLSIQEFMVVPLGVKSFREAMESASEIYHSLKGYLREVYGREAINVGDEGGFAPPMRKTQEALDALVKVIEGSGYGREVKIAIDAAASEFYNKHTNRYYIDNKQLEPFELLEYYTSLVNTYPIVSIEDPFHEDDFDSFAILTKRLKNRVEIVSDDLTVTNPDRVKTAIKKGSMTTVLIKVNQIGTVTETLDVVRQCYREGVGVMISHRSGETEETIIADLAVGLNAGKIKSGAPARGERVAKYNRLLRIEEKLGDRSGYGWNGGKRVLPDKV